MTERSLTAKTAETASVAPNGRPDFALPPEASSTTPPALPTPPAASAPPQPPLLPPNGLPPPVDFRAATAPNLPSEKGTGSESPDLANAVEGDMTTWREWFEQAPSWLASTVFHLTLVLALALLTTVHALQNDGQPVTVSADNESGDGNGVEDLGTSSLGGMDESQPLESPEVLAPTALAELPGGQLESAIGPIRAELPGIPGGPGLAGAEGGGGGGGAGKGFGGGPGDSFALRLRPGDRADMLRRGGGTPESEKAVALALRWLAEHQNYDGSWTFDHQKSPKCHGACANPGFTPGKIAATGLALMPFLGTGQTHLDGQYKQQIERGLKFLVRSMEMQGQRGGLYEIGGGQMYGHGLASIALCEAYGMTHDQTLQQAAQAAINFIVDAQDPAGGGWRYMPGQPGDTSVVGWQLMALKSAQMAYLRVPPNTMRKAGYFLDHVQSQRGAAYGYQSPESGRPATTAIGLLGRMYLGWKQDVPALQQGVNTLSILGPSTDRTRTKNNMYYNYYATQVMHHFGGSTWKRWNEVMREYLIQSQSQRGHEAGSWFLDGMDHGTPAGGRLYCTAMAAMTLEVYYRYMPLYRPQSAAGGLEGP